MGNKLDLYTGIHKGHRHRFFDIMMKAGTMDFNSKDSLDRLYNDLAVFGENIRLHASHEEKFIHPTLSRRVPGVARELEEEHRIIHQKLDDIIAQFDGIRSEKTESELRRELILELYRAWNRFITVFFTHIDKEEENVQPALWRVCTDKELVEAFKAILASQSPEELKYNLQMMLPAMNMYERADLLNAGRAGMPPQAFQGVIKLAEQVLSPDDWKILKSKIGIN